MVSFQWQGCLLVPLGLLRVGHSLLTGPTQPTGDPVAEYINRWNSVRRLPSSNTFLFIDIFLRIQQFFRPRRMEVILAQGQIRLSGNIGAPLPGLNEGREMRAYDYRHQRRRRRSRSQSSSSSSSSASSVDERHQAGYSRREKREIRREMKREMRMMRREERAQRREERRARRYGGGCHGKGHAGQDRIYRLFVVSL
jgi:hypothetical protein